MVIKPGQLICIKKNSRWDNHYINLGYKYNDKGLIFVKPEDLTKSSHKRIKMICDCCGREYETFAYNYFKIHDNIDYCSECGHIKAQETTYKNYGCRFPMQSEDIKIKTKNTINKKYGVNNVMNLESVKTKMQNTCKDKYGYCNVSNSPEINQKRKEVFINKYGKDNPFKVEEFINKANISRKENKSLRTSKVQARCGNILKSLYPQIEFDVPVGRYTLDYMLNVDGCMIDIEYDGSAWHLTDKQTAKDIERNNKIINEYGLKVLRIKSGENVPSKEQIQNAIDILINTEETYTEIILNDWQDYKNKYIS